MNINELVPIVYSNQRVLTTKQLAQAYGTTASCVKENFRRTKKQFTEGVDYFKVEGEDLRALKEIVQEAIFLDYQNALRQSPLSGASRAAMLWTEKGCVRHCKMIHTQKAWDKFNELHKVYFAVKEGQTPCPSETPADNSIDDLRTLIEDLQKENAALKEQFAGMELTFQEWLAEMQQNLLPAEKAVALMNVALLMPPCSCRLAPTVNKFYYKPSTSLLAEKFSESNRCFRRHRAAFLVWA